MNCKDDYCAECFVQNQIFALWSYDEVLLIYESKTGIFSFSFVSHIFVGMNCIHSWA